MKSSLFKAVPLLLLSTIPIQSFACQENTDMSQQQILEMNSRDLQQNNPTLLNLRSHHCQAVAAAQNEGAKMDFLPADEEWLGLYQTYRTKGDNPVQALRHVYTFMGK